MKKRYCILVLFLIIAMFSLSGCSNGEDTKIKEKVEAEIEFFDRKILGLANKLNNISFTSYILTEDKANSDTSKSAKGSSSGVENSSNQGSESSSGNSSGSGSQDYSRYNLKKQGVLGTDNSSVDWEYMKASVENLYTSWTDMIIDLHAVSVENQDILNFGKELDNLIVNIKKEDKTNSLTVLANLYSYLPKFKSQAGEEEKKINLSFLEYHVLNAYAFSEQSNWAEMKNQVAKAQEYLMNIMNKETTAENNTNNQISKLYIILNELNNAIDSKDKELFYIKYVATIENIEKV